MFWPSSGCINENLLIRYTGIWGGGGSILGAGWEVLVRDLISVGGVEGLAMGWLGNMYGPRNYAYL
jgi:hypothetical protein